MGAHGHSHNHSHTTEHIKVAFWLNLFFTIVEIVGGFYTNSIAIISDALHDLGDSFSLGLAWYFQNLSQRGRDRKFSYGYGRFSTLAAMVNSFILLLGSIFILSEAIPRIFAPETTSASGMIWLAILGLLVNGAAAYKLARGSSLNEKTVRLHLLEDVLGWAAVLVGAIVMKFTGYTVLDPIMSIGITLWVLYNVYRNLRSGMKVFLQGVPENDAIPKIEMLVKGQQGVVDAHDIHIWSLDGEYNVLTLHVVMETKLSTEQRVALKHRLKTMLVEMGYNHVTLEMEIPTEKCEQEKC